MTYPEIPTRVCSSTDGRCAKILRVAAEDAQRLRPALGESRKVCVRSRESGTVRLLQSAPAQDRCCLFN